MAEESLWGDIKKLGKIETPKIILRKQAEQLFELTDKKLEAEAKTYTVDEGTYGITFDIVVKDLNRYRVRLFECRHDRSFYPVSVYDDTSQKTLSAGNAEEFKTLLGNLLTSSTVENIIGGLLSELEDKSSFPKDNITF